MIPISFIGCSFLPKPPIDPPPPPEPCMSEVPWCDEVDQTCSTEESPCKHNPTQDPNHCELAPDCPVEPDPPPIDPPVDPIPPIGECPYVIPDAPRRIVAMKFGQGQGATIKICAGNAWCLENTGKNQRCCPPAPEGSPFAEACNAVLLKQACPLWMYKVDGSNVWKRCLSTPHPEMSCDHFDHDDPKTPDKYEGRKPVCLNDSDPVETGYWEVAHGFGYVKACTADGVCSNRVRVDK